MNKSIVNWRNIFLLLGTGLALLLGSTLGLAGAPPVSEKSKASAPAKKAPPPPQAKLGIVSPKPNALVSGELMIQVDLEVPAGAAPPKQMFAGLGGPPWVRLEQQKDLWQGKLDSSLVPNGPQQLRIVTDISTVRTAVPVQVENPLRVWFADLHSHCSYSDGVFFPEDAYRYARQSAKLDVFALTDHLESLDDNEWLDTREAAWKANQMGQFVALLGLEWSKEWGHLCIYDPPTYRWPNDPQQLYRALVEAKVVAKFNHPGDGTTYFDGLAYSEIGDQAVQLIEVRNPQEELAYRRALRLGWHLAPDGSTDTHQANWGNLRTWTAILAAGLSPRNILDALANRRCYSTQDRNCQVLINVNGAPMGSILTTPTPKVLVRFLIDDPDPNDAIASIELYEDDRLLETIPGRGPNLSWEKTFQPMPGTHYYWFKILQADKNTIWTAPVWVTIGH
ncbi:MAG: CehA/McbA family metallohydrolase [Thermoguttaceae bacterium]|nr:CehA/McbA family metallohydrolase [Thermoguttaceae bacterium]MDW8037661.1 CehA/McbA family metallohydrolase [Thermoguttaceae bacterium]